VARGLGGHSLRHKYTSVLIVVLAVTAKPYSACLLSVIRTGVCVSESRNKFSSGQRNEFTQMLDCRRNDDARNERPAELNLVYHENARRAVRRRAGR
jgi:hypothetical protein